MTDAPPAAPLPARRGRTRDAREFLPAALEVLETPANPLGRAVALALAAFFMIAVAWAFLGRIDVVAVAQGRLVPVGGVKAVQSLEAGVVRAIHVADGQEVAAGELLIELDPTESEVDREQLQRDRMEAAVETTRIAAMLDRLAGGTGPFGPPADADPALVGLHADRLASDVAAYEARMASLDAERARLAADRAALEAELAKLRATLPFLAEREATLRALEADGHAARPVWLEAKTQLIASAHDAEVLEHRVAEADAALVAAERAKAELATDARRRAMEALQDARRRLELNDIALRRADKRERQQRLTAPVDGTVQQLAVHTVGGVVSPAETLLVVVPDGAELEARAFVLNRDKGFVRAGQDAAIKLEAFPFTRYGYIDGAVLHLSGDAIEDDARGPVCDTRLSLAATSIAADGEDVPLAPGMAVTVEIATGQRRVIDFLLSPILRYRDEALRER